MISMGVQSDDFNHSETILWDGLCMGKTTEADRKIAATLEAELQSYSGLCHFCGKPVRKLVWHHVGPKLKTIAYWKAQRRRQKLIAELVNCRPAGEGCHNHHHQNQRKGFNIPHQMSC